MTELLVPSVRRLTAAVLAVLDGDPDLTVYQSTVAPAPPTDSGGVVEGYAVFHPGPGQTDRTSLDAAAGPLLWAFQVTCAGGDHDYLGWTVDRVRALLDGKSLTVDDAAVGIMQPPFGFTPPNAFQDPDVRPYRLLMPLQYQVLTVPA